MILIEKKLFHLEFQLPASDEIGGMKSGRANISIAGDGTTYEEEDTCHMRRRIAGDGTIV